MGVKWARKMERKTENELCIRQRQGHLIHKAMPFLQETVYCLEDRSRELKTELKIQKRKTKEIEDLRDSLTEQLLIFRAAIKDHNNCGNQEKT